MAEVALIDVSKSYGTVEAVHGLSLSIADGEFLVLLGPTGAGKTTTLRLIAGLEAVSEGRIAIDGAVVNGLPASSRDVAEAAARYYYGTSAANLGPEQAARLAAMVPKPRFYDKVRDTPLLERRTGINLDRMYAVQVP